MFSGHLLNEFMPDSQKNIDKIIHFVLYCDYEKYASTHSAK